MRCLHKKALKTVAVAAALFCAPLAAQAAECFDHDTDDPKAGNATAVVGPVVDVDGLSRDAVFRPESGDDMLSGDTVRTGAESHMQMKLCDWSTYTFSPSSETAISEFYDADGAGRRRVVNFVRGGLKLSSGRDTEPGSTEVEIQETGVTMGVRGTSVIIIELDNCVYIILEGPLRDNNGLVRKGLVEFWRDGNRQNIVARLKRPGYAVCVNREGVSRPFRADAALLRRVYEAFVPVIPEDEGTTFEYAGNALGESGQGAQEASDQQIDSEGRNSASDEQTERKPEQPFGRLQRADPQDPQDPMDPMDPMIPIGDILPLDALDDFAAMQANPSGHVFVLAPALLVIDDGVNVTEQDGVAIFQIDIDWQNRTIAPDALASFVKFDFSVTDPNDLTQRDFSAMSPSPDVLDGYFQALLNSAGVAFADGAGEVAQYSTPTYMLTIRQGPNDTVTADVSLDYSDTSGQGVMYAITSSADDVMLSQDEGELAFFQEVSLASVLTSAELDTVATSGTSVLTGDSRLIFSTLGAPAELNGAAVAQLEVNFDNRTVGGGSSFIAISAAADPAIGGQNALQYVALDQAVSFDSGLFGLAFFTLSSLSSSPAVQNGQALIANFRLLGADIAAILEDGSGNHLYTEVLLSENNAAFPLSTIADLEGRAVDLGSGDFHFDGTVGGRGFGGVAEFERADGAFFFGLAEASIDVNFANRTLGGGNSFVSVNIDDPSFNFNLSFSEALNAVSFDNAVNNVGVFGFGPGDFSGSNIDNALFLIRDGAGGAGETADLYFDFNDGAGGAGVGEVTGMIRQTGPTP